MPTSPPKPDRWIGWMVVALAVLTIAAVTCYFVYRWFVPDDPLYELSLIQFRLTP